VNQFNSAIVKIKANCERCDRFFVFLVCFVFGLVFFVCSFVRSFVCSFVCLCFSLFIRILFRVYKILRTCLQAISFLVIAVRTIR